MTTRTRTAMDRLVRSAARAGYAAIDDRGLLRRYADFCDQAAFAELVERHSGMVLGVCRRALPTVQDAEDACQATFLVLHGKAASAGWRPSVANWLYTTARRVAARARLSATRRARRDAKVADRAVEPIDAITGRELLAILDDELHKLPPIYREALLLCYLEGMTREDAAARLGVPAGTVKIRLERGRTRLGDALAKRGVVGGAGLLALAVTSPASGSRLVEAVLDTVAGSPSANVAALANGLATKKALLMVAAVIGLATLGIGIGAVPAEPPTKAMPAKPDAPNAAKPALEAKNDATVAGRVFAPDGKPLAGAKLLLLGRGDAAIRLGTSDANGRFSVQAPIGAKSIVLAAMADGVGIDFVDLGEVAANASVELRTVADRVIHGKIIDAQGRAVVGASVSVGHVGVYPNGSLDTFLDNWPARGSTMSIPDPVKELWPKSAALASATTDAGGRFAIAGTGVERFAILRVSAVGIADAELFVVNRAGFDPKPHNDLRAARWKGLDVHLWKLDGPEPILVAQPEKPVRGLVKDAATGAPLPGIVVDLNGGRSFATGPLRATTDAAGRYEFRGTHKAHEYWLHVPNDIASAHVGRLVKIDDTPAFEPLVADFAMRKGVIITGRVTDGETGKPLPSLAMADALAGNPFAKEFTADYGVAYGFVPNTDADGRYRIVTVPGPVLLMVRVDKDRLPDGIPRDVAYELTFDDPEHPQYFEQRIRYYKRFGGAGTGGITGEYCKVLDAKPGTEIVAHDIVLKRATRTPVSFVDPDGKPLAGVWVKGLAADTSAATARLETATGAILQLSPKTFRYVEAFEPTRRLFGILQLKGDEPGPFTIKLVSTCTVTGRALSEDGTPLKGFLVQPGYEDLDSEFVDACATISAAVRTDDAGRFRLDTVMTGRKLHVWFLGTDGLHAQRPDPKPTIVVDPAKPFDMGDLRVRPNR